MYDANSKGVSYSYGILILLGLWIGGVIIGSIVSIPIWLVMTGKGMLSMGKDMLASENVNALRVIQLVTTAIIFFLPAYFTALILNRKPAKLLGFKTKFDARQLVLSISIIFCATFVAGALAELNEMIPIPQKWEVSFRSLEDSYNSQVKAIAVMNNFGNYLISLFMIAILPGIFEETFFRGGMQNLLTRSIKIPWLSILFTSIVFSLIHLSYYGFLSRVFLGIVLGLIYHYSRSLWLSIAAHCFNNGFAITYMYVLMQKGKTVEEAMDDKMPLWGGLIGTAILFVLFVVFKKISDQVLKESTPVEDKALEEKWIA
ncbi:MAG: CPBP family intramembrane metalloprotease [Agriterribacter sp.]